RGEGVAEFGQPFAQGAVVFNDAVVDDGQPLGEVWVGVTLGGFAMGGPAGVGDAQVALDGFCGQGVFQLYDLANGAGTLDALAGDQDSDSGGVVATVFETTQAFYEYGRDVAFGDGADYSAHRSVVPVGDGYIGVLTQMRATLAGAVLSVAAGAGRSAE